MKSLSKEQRNRLIMTAGGTLLALAGIWWGPIGYLNQTLDRNAKTISEQESKVANAERLVASKIEIAQNLESAQVRLKEAEQTMAAGDMYAWIISTVNKFKAVHRVDIPQFSREVTGDLAMLPNFPYKTATFTVRGTAHFHDLGKFIADFENSLPYVYLQNLEIEPSNVNSASTNAHPEQLAFKMEIVSLINPNPL